MKLEAGTCGAGWKVFDGATGAELRDVRMVNSETRQFEYYERNADGGFLHERGETKTRTETAGEILINVATRTVKIYRRLP